MKRIWKSYCQTCHYLFSPPNCYGLNREPALIHTILKQYPVSCAGFHYFCIKQPLIPGSFEKPEDDTDYTALADGLEDSVPALIAMVLDDDLNHREEEDPAVWAPLHALRVLKVLRAESAVEPLLEILEWEDEWFAEELPEFFGAVGGVPRRR